jgi:hypothetical protein
MRSYQIVYARKLAEQLYMNNVKAVYHGECGLRMMKELARSYLTITQVMIHQVHSVLLHSIPFREELMLCHSASSCFRINLPSADNR